MEPVVRIIEEVCETMCNEYCKWHLLYDPAEHEGKELMDSEICDKCPLNKLY